MRFKLTVLAFVLLASFSTAAQQKLVFTTPIAGPTVTEAAIDGVEIHRAPQWVLVIHYQDSAGVAKRDRHQGVFHAVTNPNGADVLVKALNKANLATKALEQRAIEHLQDAAAHGGVALLPAGTVTGSPQ
jgi:hypothetical protein